MGRESSMNGANRNIIIVGKSEEKRPLERPRHRWVDSFKIDLVEIEWDGMGWIDPTQDRDQ
jgi:hypothetical protein